MEPCRKGAKVVLIEAGQRLSATSLKAMIAMTPTMMQSAALATELPHSRACG